MNRQRRRLLGGTALAIMVPALAGKLTGRAAKAATYAGALPWDPTQGIPPMPVNPKGWEFFTAEEAAAVEALVDRIIPPDPETPGGKDAGCAVFIDRQLAGGYGSAHGLYQRGPFQKGLPTQGSQSPLTPRDVYRQGLAALAAYCRGAFGGRTFVQLNDTEKDGVLTDIEKGTVTFQDADAKAFWDRLLTNTREGFFADPIYGGNRNMVGWRMIGFPGTRYDYSDWVERHNERYPLPPTALLGRAEWGQ